MSTHIVKVILPPDRTLFFPFVILVTINTKIIWRYWQAFRLKTNGQLISGYAVAWVSAWRLRSDMDPRQLHYRSLLWYWVFRKAARSGETQDMEGMYDIGRELSWQLSWKLCLWWIKYVVVDFQSPADYYVVGWGLTLTQLQLETRCSGPSRQDNKVLTAYSDLTLTWTGTVRAISSPPSTTNE